MFVFNIYRNNTFKKKFLYHKILNLNNHDIPN